MIIATLAFLSLNLGGCAIEGLGMVGAPTYQSSQQYIAQQIRHGVVTQVRAVKIDAPQQSPINSLFEAAPVALLTSLVLQHKSWQTQAAAATMATWGVAALSHVTSASMGVEMVILLDDRSLISVVQPQERDNPIVPGMKVLIEGAGRVIRSAY